MALEHKDGGYLSRKLFITLVGMVLVFAGGVVAGFWATFAAQYSTLVGGIMGLAGLYLTGNVANSFVVGKTTQKLSDNETPPEDSQAISQ